MSPSPTPAETTAQRLWLHATSAPLALCIAIGDLALAALIADPADFDLNVFLVCSVPAAGAVAWIVGAAWKANARRNRLRQSLRAALIAHGDAAADVASDRFPDIPVCASRTWIYCALEKEVDVQPLDQVIWAYAESFIFRPWFQLVIWNRHARANVLPLRKRFLVPALHRLRQAAPWLPVGYNEAMKETWNADHREFLALVDEFRQAGRPFDAPWAGHGHARVAARGKSNSIQDILELKEERELWKLTGRWDKENG